MPFSKRRKALDFTDEELKRLEFLRGSRAEEKRRTVRAAILLDARAGVGDAAIARAQRVNRNTVVRCINKCLRFGVGAALGELPRIGRPRRLSDAAITWVLDCACRKPKDVGYSYERWTYQRLTEHLHQHCEEAGYPELRRLSRSKLHTILTQAEIRPPKIRYYVERRDPDFERKMAAVLHVYNEVEISNGERVMGKLEDLPM
ncbi:MAG: helix-turn-helix domain-containing protein, partial [Terriglobia bacterium]